jgi:hypothetical protein
VLQDRQHELELVHAAAVVLVRQEVQLALEFQHELSFGKHLPAFTQCVHVVNGQTQEDTGNHDEETQKNLCGVVAELNVAIPYSL